MNARSDILKGAEELVNGDRNNQYGDPKQDFQRTADMWTAYLGTEVEPHDVAALMSLLKLSRIRWAPEKEDSWMDLAGYAACGWDCAPKATDTNPFAADAYVDHVHVVSNDERNYEFISASMWPLLSGEQRTAAKAAGFIENMDGTAGRMVDGR